LDGSPILIGEVEIDVVVVFGDPDMNRVELSAARADRSPT
jgi:hypothetical protein